MGDIEKLEDADVLKEEALKADILVCAFGPFLRSPLDRMSRDQWRRMCELNLALPGYLVTAVLPGMVRRGYGRIVLFGGTGTDLPRGYRTVAAYSAAKLGLTVIARSVAESYAGANVTCNVVVPGFVDTEYLTEAERRTYAGLSRGEKLVDPGAVARWVAEIVVSDDGVPNGAILELSS